MNDEAIDVVTLFAPRAGPRGEFERSVAEWKAPDRAVLVVVCSGVVDTDMLERLAAAGADLCVVAPTADELFRHVERARRLHRCAARRAAPPDRHGQRHGIAEDDVLDAYWRDRTARSRTHAC